MLNPDQPYKVFDMKKFQQNMSRELKRANPDRLKLENQCISAIAFGGNNELEDDLESTDNNSSNDPLRSPLWIIVINIVAMEMLRSKLPPGNNTVNLNFRTSTSKEFAVFFSCVPRHNTLPSRHSVVLKLSCGQFHLIFLPFSADFDPF